MRFLLRAFLPMLMTLSLVSGCAVDKTSLGGFNLISVEEEKQLGQKFAVEIEKKYKVVNDPEVQNFINQVGKRLLTGVQKVDFPYSFKVVQDDSINAFAAPGGYTYVHTGLIKAAESETELAAVMAHEINHVVARHSTRQMTQQYGYSLVAGLLLGNQGEVAKLAADLFGQAGLLHYSREMEIQADYLGAQTMYRAGYNPQGMVTFFRKLEAAGKQEPGKIGQFFSSHPGTSERIQGLQGEIAKLPAKNWQPESADFQRVKSKVQRL